MNGVEILSSETIYNAFLPPWCFIVGVACLAVGGLIGAILCSSYGKPKKAIVGLICIAIGVVCFVTLEILTLSDNKNSPNHIEYKVTIDDSVSMNEFLDKYEILDQDGKIYTVRERE